MSSKTLTEKANTTPPASESRVVKDRLSAISSGCLPADAHWKIPVGAGKHVSIVASVENGCDSRGWSCDNWASRSGPDGIPGYFVPSSLGAPNCPIGMLIGAISHTNAGDLDEPTARIIFTDNVLPVASHYEGVSAIDGWLYLCMNDTWSFSDNKGSVHVEVTVES